jgi:cytochrome c biogenesis protein ResB
MFIVVINKKTATSELNDYLFTDIVSTLKEKIGTSRFPPPAYDLVSHKINFAGVDIQIPYNSDQDLLCKTILRSMASMRKEWSWDEMLEKWGEDATPGKGWRTVYNAGREINNKIATETTVKNLLLVRKLSIAVNPKYIRG